MKSLQATKDNLVINNANPRFSGINIDPMDTSVYGSAIEEMYDSMVETYKNTNSLLVQPIAVQYADGKYNVVAGYTRALTYLTQYDRLLQATGASELQIPVAVFDKFTQAESLSENLVRNNQHFMATAITVGNILNNFKGKEKTTRLNELSRQLNIPLIKLNLYDRINNFHQDVKKLCYTGVIQESAALELARMDSNIYRVVEQALLEDIAEDNINDNDLEDDQDVRRYMRRNLTSVEHKIFPLGSFVDVNGTLHPEVSELSYIVGSNDPLFPDLYSTDNDAYSERIKLYWESIAAKFGKPIAEYNFSLNSSDVEIVEMGSHPDEQAMWSYNKDYIIFYVKKNAVSKYSNEYVEVAKEKIQDRADQKLVSLKAKIRKEYIYDRVSQLFKRSNDGTVLPQAAYAQYFTMRLYALSKDELNTVQIFTNTNGSVEDMITKLESCEYTGISLLNGVDIVEAIIYAQLAGYSNITGNLKEFFEMNNVDFNAELDNRYVEAEKEYEEILAKGIDKVDSLEKKSQSIQEYATLLFNCYVPDGDILGNLILNNTTLPDNLIKTVARNLGVSTKGDMDIVRKRLISSLSLIVQNYDIVPMSEDETNMMYDLCCSIDGIVSGNLEDKELEFTANEVAEVFSYIEESAHQNGFLTASNEIKFGYKDLTNFDSEHEAVTKFMNVFFKKATKFSSIQHSIAIITDDKFEILRSEV